MSPLQTIVVLYLLSGASGAFALALMWPRRNSPGGRWLVVVATLETVWMFTAAANYALQGGATPVEPLLLNAVIGVTVVCALFATPGITLAAYEYAYPGRRASVGLVAALAIVPVVLVALAVTNGYHHLYWTGSEYVIGGPGIVRNIPGPGFYGALLNGGINSVVSMVLIGQATLQSRGVIRRQGLGLLAAISVPIVAHVAVYFIGTPPPALSNPSLFNGFSLLVLGATVVRYRLLELAPAGRAEFVERMPDGLVVVDALGTVADCNVAAARFLVGERGAVVGQAFRQVTAGWIGLCQVGSASAGDTTASSATAPDGRHYQTSCWALHDAVGSYVGHALLLRDVSEVHETRERVLRATESMRIWESELDFYESVLSRQKHGH